MDGNFEEPENTQYSSQEATQEAATQELPPHYGVPPSNKTSLDESDIYCFLHPNTEAAIAIVKKAVIDNPHMVYQRPVTMKSLSTGDSGGSALDEGVGSAYDICLRKYPGPKNPEAGFVFGRSERNCDIVLSKDGRFLSNTHFRIYPTSRNILVLEDTSTNGTWVDEQILCRSGWSTAGKSRMLGNGSVILLCKNNVQKPYDVIRFTVRFPNSRGTPNLRPLGSPPPTPPDDGISQAHGNAAAAKWRQPEYPLKTEVTDNTDDSLGKWGMNSRFLIENLIGRGAFAVVHRVFERSSGQIYAVKIMQKRAFAHNTKDNQQGVRKEVDILRELDHVSSPFRWAGKAEH